MGRERDRVRDALSMRPLAWHGHMGDAYGLRFAGQRSYSPTFMYRAVLQRFRELGRFVAAIRYDDVTQTRIQPRPLDQPWWRNA